MKLGGSKKATVLSTGRRMNPTKMIMKQGSKQARAAHARSAAAPKKVVRPIKGK